jgi:hypothetical protein
LNNPLIYFDPTGNTWQVFKWVGHHWVYVADVVITVAAVTVEAFVAPELIIPTISAGLNIWSHARNIEDHPGNFLTFGAIGFGTGYLGMMGAGPLASGVEADLNDLVTGQTKDMFNDFVFNTLYSTASLGIGANLNQVFGVNKALSYMLGNMAGSYLSSSYNYENQTFDGSLSWDKLGDMAFSGAIGALSLNSKLQLPINQQITCNFLTTFDIPVNNPITPDILTIPHLGFEINLPNYYPGMNPSPLPSPVISPIPGYSR